MHIASIDCGTTNTRVYIINKEGKIFGKGVRKVGVRDTSITGSRDLLKEGLKEALYDALKSAGFGLSDIKYAISAGMITSEIGLLEIPHLWAPAGVRDLADHLVKVEDINIFPVPLPIYFIPGIKNQFNTEKVQIEDINNLDFMRGEETQAAGILKSYGERRPKIFVMLSSHTKFIPIDENGKILGSITSLSGQVYEAIKKETSIGKSVKESDSGGNPEPQGYFDQRIVDTSFACVRESGLLRTFVMSRFMDVLIKSEWYERKLFIEAALAADDILSINRLESLGIPGGTEIILVGIPSRCRIYEYLLKEKMGWKSPISSISDIAVIDQLNIRGSLFIAREAGILEA